MICCGKKIDIVDVIMLDNVDIYSDRKIYIGVCSNCHKHKYKLSEYNNITNTYEFDRNKPKRIKNINQWIDNLTNLKSNAPVQKIKRGNKSAMAFIFGGNKELKGKCVQIGYDFNGTERNRKEIINNKTSQS